MAGISSEFLMRLGKEKMAIPHESFSAPWPPSETVEMPVDAETAKLVAEDMLSEAGAHPVRHAGGMVAAMAVQSDADIRSIDVKALQKAVYPLKEA